MNGLALPVRISISALLKIGTLVLVGLWLAAAPLASAHARLESSSVAPGAILTRVPDQIDLSFTEAIEPGFSSASLIRPDRTEASPVTVAIDGTDPGVARFMIVDAASLPPGSYALLWRVVSAVDGHTTTGALAFSAGTGTAPEIDSTSEASAGNWGGTAGRWLELSGFMAIAGAGLLARIAGDPGAVLRRLIVSVLPVTAAALVITGINLIGSTTGAGFGSWPGTSRAGDILLESSPGRAWMIRTGIVVILAVAVTLRSRNERTSSILAPAAAFVALGTFPFIGHAAGLRGTAAVAFDFMHIASAAIWGGGLLLIAVTVSTSHALFPADDLVRLVTRFSSLALIVFAIIVASGLAGAWFNVAGPRNLTGEDYGRVLILKVVLSLLVVTVAAVNRLMLVPQLHRGEPVSQSATTHSLRGSALIELGLAIVILLLAARLASVPPADRPLTVDVAARSGQIDLTSNASDLTIALSGDLRNDPAGVITISVVDTATGAPVTDLARVIVDARAPDPLDPAAEPLQDRFDATPVESEPGSFTIPRPRLGLETTWTVEVIARRLGVVDAVATWDLDFTGTAAQPPRLVQETWALPRIPWSGYLALVAAAVTAVGGLLLIRRLKGLEPVTAGIILAVAGLITVGFLLSAWRSGPIPISASDPNIAIDANDPAAIQRAAPLWSMQCASCHGVDGGGTGDEQPNGGHAHPSVAGDLLGRQTQARTPAELYWIIKNGLGGTTMPAFDLALTDQERADLVAYLLWLQGQATP